MNKKSLNDKHLRSVSSSIYIIEKMVTDIERVINYPETGILTKTVNDIGNIDIDLYNAAIGRIKEEIKLIAEKYQLKTEEIKLSRLINSRKAKIWETITDTTSRKMKGYSEFPAELAAEFDTDIARLKEVLDEL